MATNPNSYYKRKKKVIVNDELSTPAARAERLKRVRNLANLSRPEICDDKTININTYKGWESAKYGGLPIDGAERVCARVAREGVICTPEWLLYEIGQAAYVPPSYKSNPATKMDGNAVFQISDDKQNILDELMLFRQHYQDVLECEIADDGLSPDYEVGDFVAGVKRYGSSVPSYINQVCIVQLESGEKLVRQLRTGNSVNRYMLMCTNNQTSVDKPCLYDIAVSSVTPILRHYRPFKK